MKKYLALILVGLATTFTFTSCDDDKDVTRQMVEFTVDPSTVISPFLPCEVVDGELETLSSYQKLRVSFFIYDDQGIKVYENATELSNYTRTVKETPHLAPGEYRLVVVSTIFKPSDNVEFWDLEDFDRLSTAKIVSENRLGFESNILGLSVGRFTVDDSGTQGYDVELEPYGAMFVNMYFNIHKYSQFEKIGLVSNRTAESLSFNGVGSISLAVKSDGNRFNWWKSYCVPADLSLDAVYNYQFVLPIDNMSLKFQGETTDSYVDLSDSWTFDLKKGECYAFILDLDDEGSISAAGGLIGEGRSSINISGLEGAAASMDNADASVSVADLPFEPFQPAN